MKLIVALAALVIWLASPVLAQQQSPEIHRQLLPAPAPTVRSPGYAPSRIVSSPQGAPHQTPTPAAIAIRHPPAAPSDLPGFKRVPSVFSLPGMRERPIARHVVVKGIGIDIPTIAVVGAPYVIEVPGLGWVYVPEDEYPDLFATLTSDDPAKIEAAYHRLQELAGAQ